jgi:alkanesulfonate monooxygenase SsuD/methylene tetrahydromethanopterin reductase-like flavin-dependent oxidoreductase (luciferase family)
MAGLARTKEKFRLLKKSYEKIGRPYDSIQKTAHKWVAIANSEAEALQMVQKNYRQYSSSKHAPPNFAFQDYLASRVVGTPDQCLDQLSKYLDIGVTYFMHYFFDSMILEHMKLYASTVMPALGEIAERK